MGSLMSLLVLYALCGFGPAGSTASLLTLEPGVRAAAMAGAGAEFGGSAASGFYNPAGLGFVPAVEVCFEDNTSALTEVLLYDLRTAFSSRRFWSAAAAVPLPGRAAVGFTATGSEADLRYREYFPPGIQKDHRYSAGLAASWRLHRMLAFGIAGRQNRSSSQWTEPSDPGRPWSPLVWRTAEGSSFCVDFGVLADAATRYGRLRASAAYLNAGTLHEYRVEDQEPRYDTLPWTRRMSVGYRIGAEQIRPGAGEWFPAEFGPFRDWLVDNWRAELAYTLSIVRHGPASHAFGVEVRPLPVLAARAGYVHPGPVEPGPGPEAGPPPELRNWTWGLGLDFKFLRASVVWASPLAPAALPPEPRYELAVSIGEPLLPELGGLR